MNHSRHFALAGTLSAALLAGCGGSSSSDPTPTPTPTPTPDPTVTLSGFVTDMPIPNATVTITVNGEQFVAENPTGADGSFEVEISSADPDALVLCEANDPDGPARFTALLNNFAGVQEEAGDDGRTEATNITNVTTAQFLLASDLATDGTIDDIEELQELAGQVDPDELIELSAAIKVVVDSLGGTELPEEFDDVQDLAEAIVDGDTTFVEDLDEGLLDEAIDAVVNDDSLTVDFVADAVPGVLILGESDIYALLPDGTGYFSEVEADGQEAVDPVDWSVNADGELVVAFSAEEYDSFVLINDAAGVLTVVATIVEADGTVTENQSLVHLGLDPDGFTTASTVGSYRALELDEDDSETEFVVFHADGTGNDIDVATGDMDDFFTWSVGNDNEIAIVDDGVTNADDSVLDDDRETVYKLDGSTDEIFNILVIESEFEGDAVTDVGAFPVIYTSDIVTGPEVDTANTLLLEGKTYAAQEEDFIAVITFGEQGILHMISQELDDSGEWDWGERDSEWIVDADGVIIETGESGEASMHAILSGLGGDMMVVAADDGSQITLDRVVPFMDTEMEGAWDMIEQHASTMTRRRSKPAGPGSTSTPDGLDGEFTWSVNADGVLVVDLTGEQPPFATSSTSSSAAPPTRSTRCG